MIKKYIDHISKIQGYSSNTCKAYMNDLIDFARWASAHIEGARWSTMRRSDFEKYIAYQSDKGYQPASTNRQLSTLRSYYKWLLLQGLVNHNPAKGVYRKTEPSKLPTTISRDTIIKAYNHATGQAKIVIALLYTTAIRIGELLNVKWQDVSLTDGTVKITGKGNRERIVYIPAGVMSLLTDWHEQHPAEEHIITWGARECRRQLHDVFAAIGSTEPCNPHSFRHTAATEWAMSGASNTMLAQALGHQRIETSQKYVNFAVSGLRTMMAANNMFN